MLLVPYMWASITFLPILKSTTRKQVFMLNSIDAYKGQQSLDVQVYERGIICRSSVESSQVKENPLTR